MHTAVVNVKVESEVKEEAQEIAKNLGLSLNAIIKVYLMDFIKTKNLSFGTEKPNIFLRKAMKKADQDRSKGKASPVFDNAEDAISYFEKQGI